MDGIESNRVGMLTIEWEMMDKNRFFCLSAINSLALRVVLYPLTVIKTRLQLQRHERIYRGDDELVSCHMTASNLQF